ncbi:nitroreductase family deazaflavin-dependent oxidoreductase [Nocardioides sp. B-3]|uniref:nitroreductase family deazaflavin-dependent oxidoreductase n=1 Tax=Nocardioides sp. B-3 TaxID=2895565 RepID=UPI002152F88D|nr:nitroreductase family deazaflavin-dependent oxidoreductase [Nocardioides sp. B-3]UUZ60552.1 nitroreductase family deazaflavin-dependent oxidoreductase [Nocardioides sp. B-3]
MRRTLIVRIHRIANAAVRRPGLRSFRGGDLLYLTTTGNKTGKQRTTPLLHLLDEDRWIVVASNGGSDWEPGWWLNLRAGSAAHVEIDGEMTPVAGVELDGAERERLWTALNRMFDFEGYRAKVSRRIAVVALSPAG